MENLLSKMYIEGVLMSKSRNIALMVEFHDSEIKICRIEVLRPDEVIMSWRINSVVRYVM